MTDILAGELVKMAAFKLDEAARTVRMLAKKAETPRLRQTLTGAATVLGEQAKQLRATTKQPEGRSPKPTQPRPRVTARRT